MNRKALIASTLISIVLTVILWNICPMVVKGVDRLMRSYHYSLPDWILVHGVFALSFGLIPFCAFLIWRLGKYTSVSSLMLHSLSHLVISIVISGYAFIQYCEGAVLQRDYLPQTKTIVNYSDWREYIMNAVIPLSVIFPFLILFFLALYRRRKHIPLRDSSVID